VALADFNDAASQPTGSPLLDLVVVDNTGAYVLPGNGDGTFNVAGKIKISGITTFTSVATLDNFGNPVSFNGSTFVGGDVKGDIALTDSTGRVWIFSNTSTLGGAISFSTGTSVNVGANPVSLTIANFNGNRQNAGLDGVAVANKAGNTVTVLVNNTAAPGTIFLSFSTTTYNTPAGASPSAVVSGNFANKLQPGFITVNSGTANVSYFANSSLPLYSTYLSGTGNDQASGIVLQPVTNNLYIVGSSSSANFQNNTGNIAPVTGNAGGQDAFVFKFNVGTPSNPSLVWQTFSGGSGTDFGTAITLDSAGNPYILGSTNSINLPHPGTPLQSSLAGSNDAFVSSFNPASGALTYGTYVGNGNGLDTNVNPNVANGGIAVDANNNIYIVGDTTTSGFAINGVIVNTANTSAFQNTFSGGGTTAYIASWAVATGALNYASYIVGTDANGIAVDPAGNAYVVGTIASTVGGTLGSYLSLLGGATPASYNAANFQGGASDAYLLKVKAGAGTNGVAYFNYFGSTGTDVGNAIVTSAVSIPTDPSNGNVSATNPYIVLTGQAGSGNFVVTNGSTLGSGATSNAWLARVDPGPAPTITSIIGTLTEDDNSDTLTINGSGFDAQSSVVFTVGGTPVNLSGAGVVTFVNANQITVKVPHTFGAGAGAKVLLGEAEGVTINVLTGEGTASAPYNFGVQAAAEVGNTVTLTTTTANGFAVGQAVFVSGVGAGYNGLYVLTGINAVAHTISYSDPTSGLGALGGGGTVTLAIADTALTAPVLQSVPATNEGGALNFTNSIIATFTDTAGTNFSTDMIPAEFTTTGPCFSGDVVINWGDGSALDHSNAANLGAGNLLTIAEVGTTTTYAIKGNHTYTEDGTYTVTIMITDEGGATTMLAVGTTITIGEAALGSPAVNAQSGTEGTALNNITIGTFHDNNPLATIADYTTGSGNVIVNYGDSMTDQTNGGTLTISAAAGSGGVNFTVKGSHTYVEEGTYTIKFTTINDKGGSTIPRRDTERRYRDRHHRRSGNYRRYADRQGTLHRRPEHRGHQPAHVHRQSRRCSGSRRHQPVHDQHQLGRRHRARYHLGIADLRRRRLHRQEYRPHLHGGTPGGDKYRGLNHL
jgi:hypothetical protein